LTDPSKRGKINQFKDGSPSPPPSAPLCLSSSISHLLAMADPPHWLPLTEESIRSAHSLIKPYIHQTPVLTSKTLNRIASTPQSAEALVGTPFEGQPPANPKLNFFFKCENYQRIGAFKARGAFHAVLRLVQTKGADEVRRRGVIAHSSGIVATKAERVKNNVNY
jgi:threonine dehydratase